jgi:hypothetical protein
VVDSVRKLTIMCPVSKVELRRLASRRAARELLLAILAEKADAYEAYRSLYGLWRRNSAALQELRPLFRMDGVEPDGLLPVTEEFRRQVLFLAKRVVPQIED